LFRDYCALKQLQTTVSISILFLVEALCFFGALLRQRMQWLCSQAISVGHNIKSERGLPVCKMLAQLLTVYHSRRWCQFVDRRWVRFKMGALSAFMADSSRTLQACGQGPAFAVWRLGADQGRWVKTFPQILSSPVLLQRSWGDSKRPSELGQRTSKNVPYSFRKCAPVPEKFHVHRL
jgi:hypothetical protein